MLEYTQRNHTHHPQAQFVVPAQLQDAKSKHHRRSRNHSRRFSRTYTSAQESQLLGIQTLAYIHMKMRDRETWFEIYDSSSRMTIPREDLSTRNCVPRRCITEIRPDDKFNHGGFGRIVWHSVALRYQPPFRRLARLISWSRGGGRIPGPHARLMAACAELETQVIHV